MITRRAQVDRIAVRRRSHRSRRVITAFFAFALVGGIGAAFAFWSGTHTRPSAFAVADSVNAGNQPTATPSGSSATVVWAASTLQSGATVDGYIVKRYDTGDNAQTVNPSCAGTIGTLSCLETNVPDGTWKYTVTPAVGLWRGTESAPRTVTVGATKLVFTSSAQTAVAGTSTGLITVQRQDAGSIGTTVGDRIVTLSSNAGTGTFRNAADSAVITTVTIPDGQSSVTFRYRDTLAGTPLITGSSGTLTAATQNVTVNAAAASQLSFTAGPASATAGLAFSPQAQVAVHDAFGNTVLTANNSITLSIKTGTGTSGAVLSGCVNNPAAAVNGVAQFAACSIDKSGTGYQLTASATGLTSANSSSFDVAAGAAAKLVFSQQPTSAVAGVAITPAVTVRIEDANGNLTTSTANVVMGFGTNAGSGTLAGTTTVAAVNGVATFSGLSIDKAASGYTLHTTSGTLTAATSTPFNITVAAANKLVFGVQPSTTAAGTAIAPAVTVRIEDAFGNLTASTANVAMAIGTNPGGGTLTGTTSANAVAGVATFSNLRINKTGTGYTLVASSSPLTAATSNPFNITPGATTALKFLQQPSNTVAGASIAPAVTVRIEDANGNLTASTASVTVAIGTNPSSGTLSGIKTIAATAGVATFSDLSINKVGTGYTLTAASGALTVDTSSSFNITVAAANKLTFAVQPTSAVAGVVISPAVTVRVEDAFGNLVTTSGATVGVALTTPGGATLSGTASVAASGGIATFSTLSVNKTGSYTLTATSTGLLDGTSSSFTISHAVTASLTFSTQPSNSTGGIALTSQPVVTIKDGFGNLVTTPESVTLSVTGNPAVGFSCTSTTVTSDVNGLATFAGCKINKAGTYTLTATDGTITQLSSSITIATGPVSTLTFSTQPSGTSSAAAVFAAQPVVTVKDAGGNLINGDSVVLAVTGNPSVGFSCTSTTLTSDVNGLASFAGCKINTAGVYTLKATDGAITATSSSVTITTGSVATLTFSTQPSASTNGGVAFAQQPVVTVKDAGGNVVSGDSVVLSVTGSPSVGFSCTSTTVTSNVSGLATFAGCKINTAVSYTLTATDGAITTTSSSVTITTGPVATLTLSTQPSSTTTAGVVFAAQPVVTVKDAGGNLINGDSVVLSVTGSPSVGFSCTSTTVTSNASGLATFAGCKITKAGSYTLTATDGAVSVASSSITINAAAVATATFSTQPSSTATAGVAFTTQPVVTVVDAFGNGRSGDSVVLSVTGNPSIGFSCTSTTVTTDATGKATFAGCTITKAGTYTLVGTDGAISATSSSVTVNAASVATATFSTQPSTTSTGGAVFAQQPIVTVIDAFANPVSGDAVVLTVTTNPTVGFACTSTTVTSDATGKATFAGCKINTAGSYTLTATDGSVTVPSNSITVSVGAAAGIAFTTQPSNSPQTVAFSTQPVVSIVDAGGNVVPTAANTAVTLSILSGGNSSGNLTCTTNPVTTSSGAALFAGCKIDKKSNTPYVLRASATVNGGAVTATTSVLIS